MRAAIFNGPGKIEVAERPDPIIIDPTDAIVRTVLACLCGSDLWYYRGDSNFGVGDPIGHEFIGVVEQVGDAVSTIKPGEFVITPFAYSDGTCPNCRVGMTTACTQGGFMPSTDGCQGEIVRVPLADGTLVTVPGSPGDYSDEVLASLLTLSDVMGTGHHAAISAGVKPGDTVAVVGDGAVGLCAVLSAKVLGAKRIIALSRHADRQQLARDFGATDIVDARGKEAVEQVQNLTDGVGVDAALECVGTNEAMQTAIAISRAGAIVGNVGLPHGVDLPAGTLFARNIGVHGGPAPVRAYLPALLDDVLAGRINPGKVFDYRTDLDGIAAAYAAMDQRRSIKALIKL